jgi:hypothetical protein
MVKTVISLEKMGDGLGALLTAGCVIAEKARFVPYEK